MFREYLSPPQKKRELSTSQAVAVAISAVLHGLLVYALLHGKITIRTIPAFSGVRNVVIGPRGGGSSPVVMGASTEEGKSDAPVQAADSAAEPTGASETEDAALESPLPPALSRPFSLRTEEAAAPVPALSREFYESLLNRVRPRTKSGLIITFSPPGSKPAPLPKTDLSEHLLPSLPDIKGESRALRASRRRSGGQRAGITIPFEGYDLRPWAEKVINLIQSNWDLPLLPDLPARARVRILTMITKSGSLSSFELLISSSQASLDQAAVRAVRLSLPFPPLPGDFPADLLEAYFEFAYND